MKVVVIQAEAVNESIVAEEDSDNFSESTGGKLVPKVVVGLFTSLKVGYIDNQVIT